MEEGGFLVQVPGLFVFLAVFLCVLSVVFLICCGPGSDGAEATKTQCSCTVLLLGMMIMSIGSCILAAYGKKADTLQTYSYFGPMRITDLQIVEHRLEENRDCLLFGSNVTGITKEEVERRRESEFESTPTCEYIVQAAKVSLDWGYDWACPNDNDTPQQCTSTTIVSELCQKVVCFRVNPVRATVWRPNCTAEDYETAQRQAKACAMEFIFDPEKLANATYEPTQFPTSDDDSSWPTVSRYGDCDTCSVRESVPSEIRVENLKTAGLATFGVGAGMMLLSFVGCWMSCRELGVKDTRGNIQDKTVLLKRVRKDGQALKLANLELRNDLEVVMAAIRQDGTAIQFAHVDMRHRRDVAAIAVQNNPEAFLHISDDFRDDKDIFLNDAKMAQKGLLLRYASPRLQANREFVMIAVQNEGLALEFASPTLRGDREVVTEALQTAGLAIQFASDELRKDTSIVWLAVHCSGKEALHSKYKIPEIIAKDPLIVGEAERRSNELLHDKKQDVASKTGGNAQYIRNNIAL